MRRGIYGSIALVLLAGWTPAAPVTLHLAGDSTMAQKLPEKRPETGWGEALAASLRDDDSAEAVAADVACRFRIERR